LPNKEKANSLFPEWPEKTSHACPVCGWESFYDFDTYEDCPQCGLADAYPPWIDPDDLVSGEWVTINEGRWIWNKYHCDVNEYAMRFKKRPSDKLPMED